MRITIFSLLIAALPAVAADWPQFRGPTGDGHYTGTKLPTEIGTDKNVVWKTLIPGKGWSSPIVWKDKIYLTSSLKDTKGGLSLHALAIDATSGKIEWDKQVFSLEAGKIPKSHGKNSYASATATTDGERLYVHFGPMGTTALDLKGEILWTRTGLYSESQHGNGGSPILVDGRLIFSCDAVDKQFVTALNTTDGKTAWETKRSVVGAPAFSFSTPTLVEMGGSKQIISEGSDFVAGYDPKSGKELWNFKFKGYSIIPKPVVGNGMVYISTGYNAATVRAVKFGAKTNEAWSLTKNAPHTPSMILNGNDLFMVSDKAIMSCVDATTGKVVWEERVKGTDHSSSPILADGKIYHTSEDGKGTIVDATRKFNVVSEFDLKEKTFASFAGVDGALYVRTESQLYRFGKK
ncbi:MAG: serine/threonine protein kinase [Gemmataceae bacterium]|nr:serine/threonine protein kinase [Gemmataceae bacterium]